MYTIDDLCLLCLVNNKSLKCSLSSDSDGVLVEEKLRFFLLDFVNIEPGISKYICLHCLKNLNHVYNFKQQCIRNIVKFNSYIHALKTTEEPCRNLQVMLFDMKHLEERQVKSENESNSEPMQTASINFDNVIVKKESNEDDTGMEYVLHDEYVQKTEVDEDILKKEDNFEEEGYGTISDNNKTEIENVRGVSMITDDEVKHEIVDEILEDIPENIKNDIKPELDDKSKYTLQNETTNNADKSRYVIGDDVLNEEHADIHCEIDVKGDSHNDSEDKLQREETINTEPFEDNLSDDEYLPSNASSTASEASNSDLELMEIQSPASSTLAVPKGTNSNVTKYTSEYLSTSNTRIRNTEENSQSSVKGDKGQAIDVIKHKQPNEMRLECDICGKAFRRSTHLIRHRLIHTGKKSYKCGICDKAFTRISTLIVHKRIHTGEKPHKCNICDKAFNDSSSLVSHIRIHTNEKPHKCNICGKAFNHSSSLVSHIRIHTNEKPHKCDICGNAFRQSPHLIRHRLIHTGEKPHICDICGKAFRQTAHLIPHRLLHTGENPHKCDICGKAFNQSSSLVSHIRIHTNEKPHKCDDICGKAFRYSTNLSQHKHIHTGEKPHKCDICGKAFRRSTHLSQHRLIHQAK